MPAPASRDQETPCPPPSARSSRCRTWGCAWWAARRRPPWATRAVRWVAVSELEDPRPFLEGGELLLTTGMRLGARDAKGFAAYAARVVEAGAVALGVGVGLTHPSVPATWARAAQRAGLPLLEVPASTPFIAVSKAVSDLLAAEEYDAVARAFDAQRDLTRAALGREGAAAVVARLARHLDGWALLLDAGGAVLAASPAAAAGRAAGLAGDLADLQARGPRSAMALSTADEHISLQPLGAGDRVRGVLVVGVARPIDRVGQSVVGVAVSLLTLAAERDDPADRARAAVRDAALALVLAGAEVDALPLAPLGWEWLRGPLRVVVADPGVGADSAVRSLAGDGRRPAAGVAAARSRPGESSRSWPTSPSPGPRSRAPSPPDWREARGRAWAAELPDHLVRARRALAGARDDGIRWHGEAGRAGLLAVVDPAGGRGVRRGRTRPAGRPAARPAALAGGVARAQRPVGRRRRIPRGAPAHAALPHAPGRGAAGPPAGRRGHARRALVRPAPAARTTDNRGAPRWTGRDPVRSAVERRGQRSTPYRRHP